MHDDEIEPPDDLDQADPEPSAPTKKKVVGKPWTSATRPRGGRKPYPVEIQNVRKLSPEHVRLCISKFAYMTYDELVAKMDSPKTTMLEMMVGNIMRKAFETGDSVRANFLLDRVVGKVKDVKEHTIKPVTYRTQVQADGSLLQEIMSEDAERPALPSSLEIEPRADETIEAQVIEGEPSDE